MVASYVGGDIVAGILGSGIFPREALTSTWTSDQRGDGPRKQGLAGERLLLCGSCLRGCGIKFGMRALEEPLKRSASIIEPMSHDRTIGKAKPIGSAVRVDDAVAEFLETG